MQNLKKTLIYLAIFIFIISIIIYFLVPYIAYRASIELKNKDYANAAKTNMLMGNITYNSLQKGHYYLTAGNCYLEIKDVKNAIKAYEKTEKNIEILNKYEKDRLTDLYIINQDYEKADSRGAKYKTLILQNNWEEALEEINREISNPGLGQMINDKIYAPYDIYLTRALIYRNIGNEELAKSDLQTALMLEPSKKTEIKNIYDNKDYFKEYYERIKKAFQ